MIKRAIIPYKCKNKKYELYEKTTSCIYRLSIYTICFIYLDAWLKYDFKKKNSSKANFFRSK